MAQRRNSATRAFGNALVHVVPTLLRALSGIGTVAMLWVGGGILLHGLDELHLGGPVPHLLHEAAHKAGASSGFAGPFVTWLVNAVGGAVVGIVIGAVIVAIVRRFTKRPEDLIVD